MELFATDRDRLVFLLGPDAAPDLDFEALEAQGRDVSEELLPSRRPKHITNYIGSKQKLADWIWKHTPLSAGRQAEDSCLRPDLRLTPSGTWGRAAH
ncbi:MAG: hypothetical protein SWH68_12195 [Thermodesulfobacteriota bacterium]|nr:hypothetical protein [Thermodesulfobacteriota bacterium]